MRHQAHPPGTLILLCQSFAVALPLSLSNWVGLITSCAALRMRHSLFWETKKVPSQPLQLMGSFLGSGCDSQASLIALHTLGGTILSNSRCHCRQHHGMNAITW
jgi:hypothetical protein